MEIKNLEFVLLHGVRSKLWLVDDIQTKTGCKKELEQLITPEIKKRIIHTFANAEYFVDKGVDIRNLLENGNPTLEEAIQSTDKVIEQLQATQKKLNLSKPFASLRIDTSRPEVLVHISYNYQDPIEIEDIINKLIKDYNEKIGALSPNPLERSSEENELALAYVAELFQNLEWLHPFFDGQGRTDLVLLAKLLTENGFNPSILYHPYFSTYEPLEKWISYLKEGMEAWKKKLEKEGQN